MLLLFSNSGRNSPESFLHSEQSRIHQLCLYGLHHWAWVYTWFWWHR